MVAGLSNVRFLLADDNEHMLKIVETIIRGFGACKLTTVRSEAEVNHAFQRTPPDIVICDYILDGKNICDIARGIRANDNSAVRFVPIILLTAHTSLSRITQARDAGVNVVCQKPIRARELFRRLVFVVDQPQPFVLSQTYVGPDRRRLNAPEYTGEERRWVGSAEPVRPFEFEQP